MTCRCHAPITTPCSLHHCQAIFIGSHRLSGVCPRYLKVLPTFTEDGARQERWSEDDFEKVWCFVKSRVIVRLSFCLLETDGRAERRHQCCRRRGHQDCINQSQRGVETCFYPATDLKAAPLLSWTQVDCQNGPVQYLMHYMLNLDTHCSWINKNAFGFHWSGNNT